VAIEMAPSPNIYSRQRAPRAKLAGSILVLIELENQKQVRAKLNQLSIHGGLLQLAEPLAEQVLMRLMFHLGSTTVRARAETISAVWATNGCLQPFRFTDLGEDDQRRLDADLQSMFGIRSAMTIDAPTLLPSDEVEPASLALTTSEDQALNDIEDSPPQVASLDEPEPQPCQATAANTDLHDSVEPTQVTVYFAKPEDALRFTVALSGLLFTEVHSPHDMTKLAREAGKVTRVTTRGMLQPG
jgi:hypothetical protein